MTAPIGKLGGALLSRNLKERPARAMFEVMSSDALLPRQENTSVGSRLPKPLRSVSE
jgi:hypothetical protein